MPKLLCMYLIPFRKYIDSSLVDVCKKNTSVAVYVRHIRGRHPRIIGVFCKFHVIILPP